MRTTFNVFVGNKVSEHAAFGEAFKAFFEAVKAMLRGGTSWQVLETACYIEGVFEAEDKTLRSPLYFYDARDFAYDRGLLVNNGGKVDLVDPIPDVPLDLVAARYAESGLAELVGMMELDAAVCSQLETRP